MPNAATWADIVGGGQRAESHRPWPRTVIDARAWQSIGEQLAASRCTLSGLWGDAGTVHMAILREDAADLAVVSLPCPDGHFPSVGQFHPAAIRPERAISDLFGLEPRNAPDMRPWLDHGRWGMRHPLGGQAAAAEAKPYAFLAAEGEGLHQIAVGPVHAGIIEPGHFRFHANGEAIARLEARLGYTHKGVESLMQGTELARAAQLAGRVCGDSTVAYAVARNRLRLSLRSAARTA
jgi:hypothetical protein